MGSSQKLEDTATAAVRQNIQERLQDELRSFTDNATQEEKRFLLDVLLDWSSESTGLQEEAQVTIAWAFECEIHNRGYYFRVDDRELFDATRQFIEDYRERALTKVAPQATGREA